jgi:hypothetical protein
VSGVYTGENLINVYRTLKTLDISQPKRDWVNVVAAAMCGGAACCCGIMYQTWYFLNIRGHVAYWALTLLSTGVLGLYVGRYNYQPFRDKHPNNIQDHQVTPWYRRSPIEGGGFGVHGTFK